MNEQKKKTKGKPWTNFGSKAAKESKLLKNPPKQIKGIQQGKKKINKADIGLPVPINIPKKFAVRVEDLLEGVEVPKAPKVGKEAGKVEEVETEDPYTSCSECGYMSLCGSSCSCSTYGKREMTDSSGCSSCECSECREQGDVCYSCSLYNESSNAGTVRSHKSARRPLELPPVPASPLTAWRKNMMMTGGHEAGEAMEEKRELMSASALPAKARTGSSVTRSGLAARRQFRESQRTSVDSSSDCSSLPRPPRAKSKSVSSSRSKPTTVSRTGSAANQRISQQSPADGRAGDQEGFFRNINHNSTVLSSVSGHNKSRHSNQTRLSEGSVSIDSLSVSSGNSQKIAFSETNMQSSLGYLP